MASEINWKSVGDFLSKSLDPLTKGVTQVSGKVADKATEYLLETAEIKTIRLEMHSHLDNIRMLALAALVATVTITLFLSFFTMDVGGLTGALLTLGLQGLGATGAILSYDVMKTCEKGVEMTSHPKNFALVNVAHQLNHRDLLMNQCQKLIEKAVEDTLLFKYVYNKFGNRFWTALREQSR